MPELTKLEQIEPAASGAVWGGCQGMTVMDPSGMEKRTDQVFCSGRARMRSPASDENDGPVTRVVA